MPYTVLIAGAGFCGSVLAAQLLKLAPPRPLRIVLLERGGSFGRGLAYAANEVPYILNVPAGRLSAEADDPHAFLRFARQYQPQADAEDFMPRALYGEYLQEVLDQAESAAPAAVVLERRFGELRRLARSGTEGAIEAQLAEGSTIVADRVVLALGNPPPTLFPWARGLEEHPAYVADPWNLPRAFRARHSVLIVGNGLTMVDVALALSREHGEVPLIRTISRRGLLPQAQTIFRPTAVQGSGQELLTLTHSMRRVLRAIRARAREIEAQGGDWREVVTYVRHVAPALWRALPERERRRFLRHVQPFWDTHRHRLPPSMWMRIDHMRRSGRLEVHAGRIQQLVADGEELQVHWRPRGAQALESFAVDALINATGPDYSLRRSRDALCNSLLEAGWISADPLDLGLRTGAHGACLSPSGAPTPHLYYLGPMLRADHWEATAALELREHAAGLARHLLEQRPG